MARGPAEGLGGLEVDHQLEFRQLLNAKSSVGSDRYAFVQPDTSAAPFFRPGATFSSVVCRCCLTRCRVLAFTRGASWLCTAAHVFTNSSVILPSSFGITPSCRRATHVPFDDLTHHCSMPSDRIIRP